MIPDETVRRVRERFAEGESPAALAREFGVHRLTVHQWLSGNWRPEAGGPLRERGARRPQFPKAEKARAREMFAAGHSRATIAQQFGVSVRTVWDWTRVRVTQGRRHTDHEKALARTMRAEGATLMEIAAKLGIHKSTAYAWTRDIRQ